MNDTEFVDHEKARAEAARFISLLKTARTTQVEAWFVLQGIADLVGPASNVGVLGLHWQPDGFYRFSVACAYGKLTDKLKAPKTLAEARVPNNLAKATAALERRIEEMGGRTAMSAKRRPEGTSAALLAVVSETEEGQTWIEHYSSLRSAGEMLMAMVRVADAYERDGVYEGSTLGAHSAFLPFENRVELIREFPRQPQAIAKARALKGLNPLLGRHYARKAEVRALRKRSGASLKVCRAILEALMNGDCTEVQVLRAVKQSSAIAGSQSTQHDASREELENAA